ncbi:MAG: M23 family metallopeptidase, partial [Cyanobacteria bacterium]|nr:M23 family metallopeptidase [Cyanobacteriota bacterium]MDW8201556.1 M23 family metallopeptidase [Cyanobacteriota bacterium SKYGB_h_bin112]
QAQLVANAVATGSNWQGASFPVENFQQYTSPFGYRQAPDGSYRREFHHGLDMAAPMGSYVRNWWTGTVVQVSDDGNCGTSVIVVSDTWEHIYCHMQGRVEVSRGQRYLIDRDGGIQIFQGQVVVSGERIGRVGMTGRTTGPHLHWGLRYQGQWVDPALVLRAMYSQQVSAQAAQPPRSASSNLQ